jgi:hypothetical protein
VILDVRGIVGLARLARVDYIHSRIELLTRGLQHGSSHLGVEHDVIDLSPASLARISGSSLRDVATSQYGT